MDKAGFADLCAKAGIEPRISGSSHYYPIDATVELALEYKLSKDQSSTDRRNEAQARKAEVETEILEGKRPRIEDAMRFVKAYMKAQNTVIHAQEMPEEAREILIEKARNTSEEAEKYLLEGDFS